MACWLATFIVKFATVNFATINFIIARDLGRFGSTVKVQAANIEGQVD